MARVGVVEQTEDVEDVKQLDLEEGEEVVEEDKTVYKKLIL